MKITSSSKVSKNNEFLKVPLNKLVNQLGKYIYRRLDGAISFDTSVNQCDIVTIVIYQIKFNNRRIGYPSDHKLNEMRLNINITTYQNKLRVNIIEISPNEKTLGSDVYPVDAMTDMIELYDKIWSRIQKRLIREYSEYDFLF